MIPLAANKGTVLGAVLRLPARPRTSRGHITYSLDLAKGYWILHIKGIESERVPSRRSGGVHLPAAPAGRFFITTGIRHVIYNNRIQHGDVPRLSGNNHSFHLGRFSRTDPALFSYQESRFTVASIHIDRNHTADYRQGASRISTPVGPPGGMRRIRFESTLRRNIRRVSRFSSLSYCPPEATHRHGGHSVSEYLHTSLHDLFEHIDLVEMPDPVAYLKKIWRLLWPVSWRCTSAGSCQRETPRLRSPCDISIPTSQW